jgi:Rap1a immunity proteins
MVRGPGEAGAGEDWIMRLTLAVVSCLLAVPAFAAPDVNSANFILPHCRAALQLDKPPGFMSGLCAGIIDALVGVSSILPEGMRFCPPASSTNAQQQRVVVLYVEKHPERLHENFKHLVVDALREAWPCPK